MRNKIFVTRADFHFDLQRFADDVTYLDANGTEQTVFDATILDGSETTLDSGWYIVNSDLEINEQLNFNGDTHLILADGAKLTINGNIDGINVEGTLNIYGQSGGTGKLEATGTNGIFANNGDVNIYGGQVTANGKLDGIFANNINLSWTKATNFIDASNYDGNITISKRFYDESGNIYDESGNIELTSGKISALDGYFVELPDGVNVTSDNLTRIGTTNKYICAAGEVTFTNDESKFVKITGITVDGEAISGNTYTVTGDIEVTVEGLPNIDGLSFNSEGEYYEIGSTDALIALASYVNGGHDCAGLKFKLTADLDFTNLTFDGIGTATTAFKGTFSGDNQYSINKLTNCVFNYIDDGANISGLKVYYSVIQKSCGIIVDNMLGGTISDCTVKNGGVFSFDSGSYAGGIVGNGTGGSVTNCNAIDLILTASNTGSIVGNGSITVSGCKFANVVNLIGTPISNVGGDNANDDGTNTQYFALSTPNGVTATCTNAETHEVTIDGEKFYTSGATFNVTVDLETSDYVKITKFNGEPYTGDTYTLTLTGDTSLNLEGYPKIDGLTFNADENYYEISSADDLQALASYVNSGNTCAGLIFKQTADIDLGTIENFTPIGDCVNYHSFEGTFDGCG